MTLVAPALLDLRITLPASLNAVEEFFRSFRRQHGFVSRPGESFVAELLLREALINAVVHGCGRDGKQQIYCRIRRRGANLTFLVRDGGEGFDWRKWHGRDSAATAESGRGIEIFRRYANRYRYNKSGNCLTIWKRFSQEMEHD